MAPVFESIKFSGPFEKSRPKDGPILAVRVGVCVSFAPLATLALIGSKDIDAFALLKGCQPIDKPGGER